MPRLLLAAPMQCVGPETRHAASLPIIFWVIRVLLGDPRFRRMVELMIKASLKNPALRKRASQFTRLVRHSVVTPRTGQTHKPQLVTNGELGVTFIGHSSFFLQIGGQSIVIDPNFARWLFLLKRIRKPGLHLRDLPPVDVILVTHAHFDHLHRQSLRTIGWNTYRHRGLDITHVPSRHWGARIIKDSHRGYGGYVLRSGKHSVYHAGDTAYFSGFREIGRRLAPELALLPIGAYNPPQFRNVHTSPADAMRAFLDLNARWMVPMHYGTFRLSHEPIEEPLQLLGQEAEAAGVKDRVVVLEEGVTHFF